MAYISHKSCSFFSSLFICINGLAALYCMNNIPLKNSTSEKELWLISQCMWFPRLRCIAFSSFKFKSKYHRVNNKNKKHLMCFMEIIRYFYHLYSINNSKKREFKSMVPRMTYGFHCFFFSNRTLIQIQLFSTAKTFAIFIIAIIFLLMEFLSN